MLDKVLKLVVSWPEMIIRAFTEHTLAAAVVTVAAVGILVVLQKEIRPYRLLSNIGFVAGGWLITISLLVPIMAGLRKGWALLEGALPWAAKLSAYLYGICERHPILALVIVGVGTTAYFLRGPWPLVVAWGPVRAVCTIFGIALMIHIAAPIADIVAAEDKMAALPQPEEKFTKIPAEAAFARAIKEGDTRYVSVRQCVDEVSGYPVSEPGKLEIASPWTVGVRRLGASCYESVGLEGDRRMRAHQAYAAEYNRLMYKHNKGAKVQEQVEQPQRPVPVRIGGIL